MAWDRAKGTDPKYRSREHKQARAAMIDAFHPGDPCCICGHPMYPPTSKLHADHNPSGIGYRGLAHGSPCSTCGLSCNQHDGAKRGRARQTTSRLQW